MYPSHTIGKFLSIFVVDEADFSRVFLLQQRLYDLKPSSWEFIIPHDHEPDKGRNTERRFSLKSSVRPVHEYEGTQSKLSSLAFARVFPRSVHRNALLTKPTENIRIVRQTLPFHGSIQGLHSRLHDPRVRLHMCCDDARDVSYNSPELNAYP